MYCPCAVTDLERRTGSCFSTCHSRVTCRPPSWNTPCGHTAHSHPDTPGLHCRARWSPCAFSVLPAASVVIRTRFEVESKDDGFRFNLASETEGAPLRFSRTLQVTAFRRCVIAGATWPWARGGSGSCPLSTCWVCNSPRPADQSELSDVRCPFRSRARASRSALILVSESESTSFRNGVAIILIGGQQLAAFEEFRLL